MCDAGHYMKNKLTIVLSLIITGLLLTLICYIGLKEIELKKYSPETVIYEDIGFYPGYYYVYVFESEKVTVYDFSSYWSKNGFDYFTDPLPQKDEYKVHVYSINEYDWNDIVNTLNKNKYNRIRKNLSVKGITDGGYGYIEVKTCNKSYSFGGYCPEKGNLISSNRYKKIIRELEEEIEQAKERANAY